MKPSDTNIAMRLELIRRAEAVLAKDPKNAAAHFDIGVMLKEDARYPEAIGHLLKSLKLSKRDISCIEQLADCYFKAHDYVNARKFSRKLVEAKPRDIKYLRFHAKILEAIGSPAKALEYYQRAYKLAPEDPVLLQALASCLRSTGRIDEALVHFEKLVTIEPTNDEAIFQIAHNNKFDADKAAEFDQTIQFALEANETALEQNPKNDDLLLERGNICYAGGKIWADASQYDRAFDYYNKANAARWKGQSPIPHFLIQNAIFAFDRNFFAERADYGHHSDAPIFILGLPRSGTTLVEGLCGGHSKIAAAGELIFMTSIMDDLGLEARNETKFRDNIAGLGKDDVLAIGDTYLKQAEKIAGKTRHFTDKLPHNFLNIGLIKLVFPKAKIIFCRRHPLDNGLSLYTNSMLPYHNRYKCDLPTLGLYYRQYVSLLNHWRHVLSGQIHEVYYEDVVANTEFNARAMIDYLGLDWEDGVLEHRSSQKAVHTLSAWQVRQPIYTSSAGRWRRYEKHLKPLIEAMGPTIAEYEAELEDLNQTLAREAQQC